MNTNKRSIVCRMVVFALSGLAQISNGQGAANPHDVAARVNVTPVRVAMGNLRVEGERGDSAILREESFIRFQYAIENEEFKDQRAKEKQIVWWNQSREAFLKRGDTNNANRYPEKPIPVFQSCALKLDKAVFDWMLAPSIKIFRVLGRKDNKAVRGEGWSVDELGGMPALELSKISMSENFLEAKPLMIYGRLDKALINKLGIGTYECEISLDTKRATGLNVADTGNVSRRFIFRIKDAENEGEKWWLEQKKFREAGGKGEWKTVLSLADNALKRYQSQDIVYWLWCWKGNALQSMGKDEESLAAFEEAWKHRWKNMEPHDEWPVTEPMRELRRKLKEKADKNSAQ